MQPLSPRSHLRLALALVVLPLTALVCIQGYQAFWRAPEVTRDQAWVEHSFEVITSAEALRAALENAERKQRGYLLTGDSRYLAGYRSEAERVPLQLERLKALTSDNPDQQLRISDVTAVVGDKLREMQRTIAAYDGGGLTTAKEIVQEDVGLDAMRIIEHSMRDIISTERVLLGQRVRQVALGERQSGVMALVGCLLALAVTAIGALLAIRTFAAARALEARRREAEQRASEQERRTQATLAQTQKMEAVGQLTGGVAHDFNNLLHVIRNAVSILQRQLKTEDADVRRYLDMIRRNADRAATTTARLLAFSRRQALNPRPTDLNALLAGMDDLLRQVLGGNIVIETVLGSGLWSASIDPNQLENAVVNLAVNARDAMPSGGKLTIETSNAFLDDAYVETHEEVAAGQYAMIAVSDTGSGMTQEVLDKAFEPFFTTKDIGRGTGLGLSQVFGFVKQSGGHVKIDSEPGRGTTVKLYLPRLVAAAAEAVARPRSPPRAVAGESFDRCGTS